ncbi:FecR domain-containing protein [Candidatus Pelagibacter sp.]|nr:FecR domain-containing protein [Candidatus Pelagibacter sp.]
MNVSHKKITLNYRNFFFKIFFLYIFLINIAFSEGTKIGSITEINGEVIAITEEGDERILDVYDEIYLKDEILIGESSSATIQFDDNTTIVMKELTSLNVSEFEKSGAKQKFQAKVGKGKIIIETGAIAKNANGEMLIDLSNMSLGIRGTRFNANVKPNGNSEVALAEDSFGNVGQIEISSEGQSASLTSTDQVIEVTETREIEQREQSDEEKQEFKSVNETLVKVSKIDENELTQQLEEKLAKGNLQDANNDGVVDASDVEAAKEIIKEEKKQKIDFIVENSNDENTTFLSDVIDQSDDQNIGETIEKIIETKDTLVEGVVGNLSDKDNEFITTSTSEGAGLIKEKIFETIVAKETDKSAEVLSKVMAKSDEATINSVINNITEKNTNEESKLSLKVMADFSEKAPEKLQALSETNKDQIDKLAVSAVEKASTSNEDANLIAKVVSVASDELANKVVQEVSKNNTSEKQDLSAKVLKAIVETQPNKIEIINDEIKEVVIKQTVEAVKTQQETETNIAIEDDLTDAVASIIVSTDNDTAAKLIEEVSNVETESNLSLKVIAGISEKSAEKFSELAQTNKDQVEKLTISAIQKAENTTEDSQRIANVVAIVNDELANKVVEEVSKTAIDEKKSLSIKVLKAIVDTEPEKMEIINEEIKEDLIEQAIEATKDQKEGNLIEEDDLTDAVTEIIVKTDVTTAEKVIEEINKIDTETNLSLEVISGISEKDSGKLNELSDNNKEQMDELTTDAVQKAENTSEDSQLIANVIAVVNDDLVNKVVEEVSKSSTDEKQSLSAKVLKAIVDTEPSKIETLDEEIKDKVIEQTIDAAKNQQENLIEGEVLLIEDDLTDIVADIVTKANNNTAAKVLETLNEVSEETDSKISLSVVENLTKKDNYEEKIEILSVTSTVVDDNISKIMEKAVEQANSENDIEKVKNIVENSKGTLSDKLIESANKNEESKKKITEIIVDIVEENPEKAVEIIEKNKNTTTVTETIKTKIENNEAVTSEDFEDVFDTNVSPN